MGDTRNCEQCGISFAPRREHARFCSARCRVAWNREHTFDPTVEVNALEWSFTALHDTADRLPRVRAWDRPRAFAVIGEAVWWVTIVDGTLVRHHPEAYDEVLGCLGAEQRRLVEGTLGGLRYVRNRMGHDVDHVDFIDPQVTPANPGSSSRDDRITDWTWKSAPEPTLAPLAPRGQAWEITRYRAYKAHLAGHTIGEIFGRAADFLKVAAGKAIPEAGAEPIPRLAFRA